MSGLWLVFIGWFMNDAAARSYQQVVMEDMLRGQIDRIEGDHVVLNVTATELLKH